MRSITPPKESGAVSPTAISLAARSAGSGMRTGAISVAASIGVPSASTGRSGRGAGSGTAVPSAASDPPAFTNRNTAMAPATMPGPSGQ